MNLKVKHELTIRKAFSYLKYRIKMIKFKMHKVIRISTIIMILQVSWRCSVIDEGRKEGRKDGKNAHSREF